MGLCGAGCVEFEGYLDLLCPLLAEFAVVVFLLVDGFGGVGVQVEGIPGYGEGVIGVGGFVQLNCFVESVLADVAPARVRTVASNVGRKVVDTRDRRCLKQYQFCSWSFCVSFV